MSILSEACCNPCLHSTATISSEIHGAILDAHRENMLKSCWKWVKVSQSVKRWVTVESTVLILRQWRLFILFQSSKFYSIYFWNFWALKRMWKMRCDCWNYTMNDATEACMSRPTRWFMSDLSLMRERSYLMRAFLLNYPLYSRFNADHEIHAWWSRHFMPGDPWNLNSDWIYISGPFITGSH